MNLHETAANQLTDEVMCWSDLDSNLGDFHTINGSTSLAHENDMTFSKIADVIEKYFQPQTRFHSMKKHFFATPLISLAFLAALLACTGANAQRRDPYGQKYVYTFVLEGKNVSDSMTFEDDTVVAKFAFSQNALGFAIKNKTLRPAKLHWEESSLKILGTGQRVLHSDILYGNRDQPQISRMIPPETEIRDYVFPAANVHSAGVHDILPAYDLNEQKHRDMIMSMKNQEITFFVSMEFAGQRKDCAFKFRVTDVAPAKNDTLKKKRR